MISGAWDQGLHQALQSARSPLDVLCLSLSLCPSPAKKKRRKKCISDWAQGRGQRSTGDGEATIRDKKWKKWEMKARNKEGKRGEIRKEARRRKKWEGTGGKEIKVGNSVTKREQEKNEDVWPLLGWACHALTPSLLPWFHQLESLATSGFYPQQITPSFTGQLTPRTCLPPSIDKTFTSSLLPSVWSSKTRWKVRVNCWWLLSMSRELIWDSWEAGMTKWNEEIPQHWEMSPYFKGVSDFSWIQRHSTRLSEQLTFAYNCGWLQTEWVQASLYGWIRFQEFICENRWLRISNALSHRNNVRWLLGGSISPYLIHNVAKLYLK